MEYEYVGIPTINFLDEKERPGKGTSFFLSLSLSLFLLWKKNRPCAHLILHV